MHVIEFYGFELRSDSLLQLESIRHALQSSRSERQHKAWGASPRLAKLNINRARETGDSLTAMRLSPVSRAPYNFLAPDPGACAPGFMLSPVSRAPYTFWRPILGLAPQALCCRSLPRALITLALASFAHGFMNFATPLMNICTASITSNIPINRSIAITPRSFNSL